MIDWDALDDDDTPTREKIHRNSDPVNAGHDTKKGAEIRKNRAVKTLRRLKDTERDS